MEIIPKIIELVDLIIYHITDNKIRAIMKQKNNIMLPSIIQAITKSPELKMKVGMPNTRDTIPNLKAIYKRILLIPSIVNIAPKMNRNILTIPKINVITPLLEIFLPRSLYRKDKTYKFIIYHF